MTERAARCFLFHRLAGTHPAWTLAVFAISRQDALDYVRSAWRGGTLIREVTGGDVRADCGGTTEAAQEAIGRLNEEMMQ